MTPSQSQFRVTFRPAGITAKAAATLSALTGGRAFVGIGAGWWERELLPETTSYPRPAGPIPVVVVGSGERRTLRILATHGEDVAVTLLDLPVVGTDRDDVWARVERQRGHTPAATYAARTHAATVAGHCDRWARLAGLGVETMFIATPDLGTPDDVLALRGLNA